MLRVAGSNDFSPPPNSQVRQVGQRWVSDGQWLTVQMGSSGANGAKPFKQVGPTGQMAGIYERPTAMRICTCATSTLGHCENRLGASVAASLFLRAVLARSCERLPEALAAHVLSWSAGANAHNSFTKHFLKALCMLVAKRCVVLPVRLRTGSGALWPWIPDLSGVTTRSWSTRTGSRTTPGAARS